MPFEPRVNQELDIDGVIYRVAEHPAAPGMVYGQEGRRAIVYQLVGADGGHQALKVFKPRFRVPRMVAAAERLEANAGLPGLQVCQRTVLTGSRHLALLRENRDLAYAVLMPWVEGATWQELILSQQDLSPGRALGVAHSLARVLMTMEERGLAHCDLSGPNLIVQSGDRVALVDLEEMYGPGFMQPEALPAGSPGYAHKSAPLGLWQAQADRFAGAVLLAEMLGWCDPKVRATAWGESYFSPAEMQGYGERYQTLHASLAQKWGQRTADLFAQAWRSDSLLDCPTFAEWMVALPEKALEPAATREPRVSVALLVLNAETAADTGSWDQALELYRQALEAAPPELAAEITARIATVEARRAAAVEERAKALPAPPTGPEEVDRPQWSCPQCGRPVGKDVEVCPFCERGNRDKTVVRARPVPTWRCPNCGRQAPGEVDVCPYCELGQPDGTMIARRRPEPHPEPPPVAILQEPPASLPQPRKRRVPCLVWILAGIGAVVICFLLLSQLGIVDYVMQLALPELAAEAPAMPTEEPAAEPTEAPVEPTEAPLPEPAEEAPEPTEAAAPEPPLFEPLIVGAPCGTNIIQEIAALDELTVQFSLCRPDPALALKAALPVFYIQPQEWIEGTGGTGELIEHPIGTGPFYLESWNRGDAIIFRRFEDYWGERAVPETLVFRWLRDRDSRLLALQAGDVDLIAVLVSEGYEAAQRDPSLQFLVAPGLNIAYLAMTNTFAPWDDVQVRQAIAVGIDRQRIVENYYPPGSEVASHFTPCAVPSGCAGGEWPAFDPELARALLWEAGYPDGFQTSIYYRDVYRTYLPDPAGVAADIQAQLRENLGVEAEVVPMESGAFMGDVYDGRLDGLYLFGWYGEYLHVMDFLDNPFGYSNRQFGDPYAEIYEVLEEAAAVPDWAATSLYAQANDAIRELVPMVPIAHGSGQAYVAAPDVEGVLAPMLGPPPFWKMSAGGREYLVYAAASEPWGLYCMDESDTVSMDACAMVTEGLVAYDQDGVLQPRLAVEWEVTEDAAVWTFFLRSGVRFHDGSLLDANDVVMSWGAGVDAASPYHHGNSGDFWYVEYLFGLMNSE